MRNRLSFGIIAVLVLSLLISACSAAKDYQEKDDFNTKTEDFIVRLQWQDFIGLSLHFREDLREDLLERFEDWDTLKVSSVTTSRVMSELDGTTERKIAYYWLEYYLLTEMKVHKEKIKIVWELAPVEGNVASFWRIVEPFPELEVKKK